MSTGLQLHAETMADWQIMRQQAEMLVKSSFLPKDVKTPEQALAIILMGRELGIGIMQSFSSINIIAGKPTIGPQLMLALINRTGQLEDMLITDDGQCCAVTMRRKGRQPHSEAFSMKDAALMKTTEYINGEKKTISLSEKYNWRQQPAVMRKWRAVAACARVVFPDVILGVYTPDELGAEVDGETGEVVTLEPVADEVSILDGTCAHEGDEPEPVEVIDLSQEIADDLARRGIAAEIETKTGRKIRAEPVRAVKLEGAQPTSEPKATWPQVGRKYAPIFGKCVALNFARVDLANYIQMRFNLAVSDDPVAALDALTPLQLKELDQALAGEFNNRNR